MIKIQAFPNNFEALTKTRGNRKIPKKSEGALMQEDKLLTTKQVAEELSRSERWVINQIQAGAIAAIDLGKGWRVRRSELDRYLREREKPRKDE